MEKYVGYGVYIDEWKAHDGPEGNLKRNLFDMTHGLPEVQFAQAASPEEFVGTFATFPEIDAAARKRE